jgi:hypothetical protein
VDVDPPDVSLTYDVDVVAAVPFEAEAPTFAPGALPLPSSRPPHAPTLITIAASHAKRMSQA